jgi:cell division cycle 20-like protein 1 (cofactor of APC complex)
LKWSPDGYYFACGSNDNSLMVFSPKTRFPIMKKRHSAAVKAIDWNPRQRGILASGGGTADRKIKLWNVNKQSLINEIDTGSQICTIKFAKKENEIITTHGFSQNEISIWSNPSLTKIKSLYGHNQRVLFQSMSPNGEYIVTGAGDETLRFWDLNYKENIKFTMNEENLYSSNTSSYKFKNKRKNKTNNFNISVLR